MTIKTPQEIAQWVIDYRYAQNNKSNSVKIGATVLFITGIALITSSFIENDKIENSTKVAYGAMIGLFTVSYIYVLTLE